MEKVIHVSKLEPGMVLASSLCDVRGLTLFAKNTELNQRMIDILKTRNIKSAIIEVDAMDEIDENTFREAHSFIIGRMNWEPRNHHEITLIKSATVYNAIKLGENNDRN